MFSWAYCIKESESCTKVFMLKTLNCDMMPTEKMYKQLGLTLFYGLFFVPKERYKGGGIPLCATALPGARVFTCLLVWKQLVLHPPKSYQKFCLLFPDGCNTLPKFREIGWRALGSMCPSLGRDEWFYCSTGCCQREAFHVALELFIFFSEKWNLLVACLPFCSCWLD